MTQEASPLSYKHTLQLPTTEFPIRPSHEQDQSNILKRWQEAGLYAKTMVKKNGAKTFIIIDGPPYANGPLHLGHAYNKILKDIIGKSKRMAGFHVPLIPGWDCHGLPIELKVTQENKGLDRLPLQKACRSYAQKWMLVQKEEFKALGVLMDWDNPYLTMDYGYEAATIKAFGKLYDQGYIELKNKTIPWCYSCQTVLATAEIEYAERKDPSIYVLFQVAVDSLERYLPALKNESVFGVIWTTTPWTLLLNRAIAMRPDTKYAVLQNNDCYLIVAHDLVDNFCKTVGIEKVIHSTFLTEDILSKTFFFHHPLINNFSVPLILDDTVLLSDGTALVNNAPGAGPEDYEVGLRHNIAIFSPVGPSGCMTSEIEIKALEGKTIAEVQSFVLSELLTNGLLLHKGSIKHQYPHCWRCHNGLIFRATQQWFCNLMHNDLQKKSLSSINTIKMLPEGSEQQFKATVASRVEWCLSRQRAWGTPIPAILCNNCRYIKCDEAFISMVAHQVALHGVEWWTEATLDMLGVQKICPSCKKDTLFKEKDILDVWFDAGVGHTAVIKGVTGDTSIDLFIEGKDQHRGYFQSSLLTSVALNDAPCMKTIITHGFTVDDKGRKMSKSLGNGVEPATLVKRLGIDGVRLWVSSVDLSSEVVVSEKLLENTQEVYRKIRNTCRFLLSNLFDFDIQQDGLGLEQVMPIDQIGLLHLDRFIKAMKAAYDRYDLTAVFHLFADYTTTDLSSFYLDIIKDRLYVEEKTGFKRRSAQTVCYYILDTLTKLMAPILSFTAELVSDLYQKQKLESIHLQEFPSIDFSFHIPHILQKILPELLQWRAIALKKIEALRELKVVKHSLEARLSIAIDTNLISFWQQFKNIFNNDNNTIEQFLADFFIVSCVDFMINLQNKENETECKGFFLVVDKAVGEKCVRCWQWRTDIVAKLCNRCRNIVL